MSKYIRSSFKIFDDAYLVFIKRIKQPFKHLGLKAMDNSLRRIINLDFHNSNMGLGKFMNRIFDQDENKRFQMMMPKLAISQQSIVVHSGLLLLGVTEWLILVFTIDTVKHLAFTVMPPYLAICMLVLVVLDRLMPKNIYKYMMAANSFMLVARAILGFGFPSHYTVQSNLVKRYFSSVLYKLPIIFTFATCVVYECFSIYK